MNNNTRRLAVAAMGFASMLGFLVGCSKSEHSVEWYVEHKAEREAKLKWCNDDMSRATDVDCLNASKAKERAMLQGPSAAESFKFNPAAVPQGDGSASSAASTPAPTPAPAKSQKSAADSFKFDPSKVPQGGK